MANRLYEKQQSSVQFLFNQNDLITATGSRAPQETGTARTVTYMPVRLDISQSKIVHLIIYFVAEY